jgi:hypothetical protein
MNTFFQTLFSAVETKANSNVLDLDKELNLSQKRPSFAHLNGQELLDALIDNFDQYGDEVFLSPVICFTNFLLYPLMFCL